MKNTEGLLNINKITKIINSEKVLDQVDLKLSSGNIYGLLGQNGTGKTTLMKCILGLDHVDEGQVIFENEDITNGKNFLKRSMIGSLIESPNFPLDYTVSQVLEEQLKMMNVNVDKKYLDTILDTVELAPIKNKKVRKLSLGWRQKVGVARAMYNYPRLLLLDEPFNGLDVTSVQSLEKLLTVVAKQGMCILISSHIIDEMKAVSNELFVLKEGKVSPIPVKELNKTDIRSYYLKQFGENGEAYEK